MNQNLILFFLVCLAYPLAAEPLCKSPKSYIVDSHTLNVRGRPEITSPVLRTLADGIIVQACATKQSFSQGGKSDFWYRLSDGGYIWGRYLQEAHEQKLLNGYSAIHAFSMKQLSSRVLLLHEGRRLCNMPVGFGEPVGVYVSESGRYFILSPGTDVFRGWEVYRTQDCSRLFKTDGISLYTGGWKGERMHIRDFRLLKKGLCQYRDTIFDDGAVSERLSVPYADEWPKSGHENCASARLTQPLN